MKFKSSNSLEGRMKAIKFLYKLAESLLHQSNKIETKFYLPHSNRMVSNPETDAQPKVETEE